MPTRKKKPTKKSRTPLATVRSDVAQLTQVQVAEKSGFFQSDVSKIERHPDLKSISIHTLRRYVEALGGELQLVAVVNGRSYELRGAEEPDIIG